MSNEMRDWMRDEIEDLKMKNARISAELAGSQAEASRLEATNARISAEWQAARDERDAARAAMAGIATHIHYPECWDTAAYPTVVDAVREITHCDPAQCTHVQQDGKQQDGEGVAT